MNPVLLQKQLKDNANDLEDFCRDLKSWGEEMKRKEDSRNEDDKTMKKVKPHKESKVGKKGPTDYAKWEKFDADLECNLLEDDINDDSELTDEFEESKRDEALVHKEKGNAYVKSKEWNKAIQCYTAAIKCYSYDAVFYANRALCYLKLNKFDNAEADCTLSLKLDKTYVKALQRRAAARQQLGELDLAISDLETVLKYEPKNKESIAVLASIRKEMYDKTKKAMNDQRPISKFTASRSKLQNQPASARDVQEKNPIWPNSGDDITLVKTIKKPVHLRSSKPLKRIDIVDMSNLPEIIDDNADPVKKHVVEHVQANKNENEAPVKISAFKMKREQTLNEKNDKLTSVGWPAPSLNSNLIKCEDLKVSEKKLLSENNPKDVKNTENLIKTQQDMSFSCPTNSVQFYAAWKALKTQDDKYTYLKRVNADRIPTIFKESLETGVFSSILDVLAKNFIENKENVYDYLDNLTRVKRFSALTMFLDTTDKSRLWKLITYLIEQKVQSREEVSELIVKYEL